MKIKTIEIHRFGKLEHFTLDLDDGFNMIYGRNEDGKTTIMTFIKMMFYGSSGKSTDLAKNVRKKYTSWNGMKMSGSIEFEDQGMRYRLERQFGVSNTSDKIHIWNLAAGQEENIAGGTDLGQRFFGMGAAAFEKSVYIGQAGSVTDGIQDKEDEITGKLLNLVSTGDERVSHMQVDGRLQTAKETLKSRSGRIGVCDKLNQELARLAEEKVRAQEDEAQEKTLENTCLELEQQKEIQEQTGRAQQHLLDQQQLLDQARQLDGILQKWQMLDELDRAEGLIRQKLKGREIQADQSFIDDGEKQAAQVQDLTRIYDERQRYLKDLAAEQLDLQHQEVPGVSSETADQIKGQVQKLQDHKQNIQNLQQAMQKQTEWQARQSALMEAEKQLADLNREIDRCEKLSEQTRVDRDAARHNLTECEARLTQAALAADDLKKEREAAFTNLQVAASHQRDVGQWSAQRLEAAAEQLKQASVPKQVTFSRQQGRGINKILLSGAVILLLLSIIGGLFVHPACYAGILLALALGAAVFGRPGTKQTATTIVDENAVRQARMQYEKTNLAVQKEQEAADAQVSAQTKAAEEIAAGAEQARLAKVQREAARDTAAAAFQQLEQIRNEQAMELEFLRKNQLGLMETVAGRKTAAGAEGPLAESGSLEDLQSSLDQEKTAAVNLEKDIAAQLAAFSCTSLDDLQNKAMLRQSFLAKIAAKNESLAKAQADEQQAGEILARQTGQFIQWVGRYQAVSTLAEAQTALGQARQAIRELTLVEARREATGCNTDEWRGKTRDQIEQEIIAVKTKLSEGNHGVLPELMPDGEREQLKEHLRQTQIQRQAVQEKLIQLTAQIKNTFGHKPNVSQVEADISRLKNELADREKDYECLELAQQTLTAAFNEIRQSFGPLLNEKTAAILSRLTGGKYQNVLVSRTFDIHVQDAQDAMSHEWQYLSSGTIDQAYLALRLAVADLLSQNQKPLPLLLDDVLMQYDDARAEQGLRFLAEYAEDNNRRRQILLFTCHENLLQWAEDNPLPIATRRLFPSDHG
ncbi:MAG: AAA family ATPase [Clostridiaceae bacterium]|nr:AAA family ATPase [Clostridiaceae bacterium]